MVMKKGAIFAPFLFERFGRFYDFI